jgi:septal ring factor EnvC (AmiA/AmiB activator)
VKRKTHFFHAALLTLLLGAALTAAGCSLSRSSQTERVLDDVLESYREQVSQVIEDRERAGRLSALGEELVHQLREDTEELREMAEEFRIQNARYDTTREELEVLLAAINEHRREMGAKVLAARAGAVSLTTPVEWQGFMDRRRTLRDLARENPGLF